MHTKINNSNAKVVNSVHMHLYMHYIIEPLTDNTTPMDIYHLYSRFWSLTLLLKLEQCHSKIIYIYAELIHYSCFACFSSAGFFWPAICFLVGTSSIGAGFTNLMNSSIPWARKTKVCKIERSRGEMGTSRIRAHGLFQLKETLYYGLLVWYALGMLGRTLKRERAVPGGMYFLSTSGTTIPSSVWLFSNTTQMALVVAHIVALSMWTYSTCKNSQTIHNVIHLYFKCNLYSYKQLDTIICNW